MYCLRVNVTSPRQIPLHILMSLAYKLPCILVSSVLQRDRCAHCTGARLPGPEGRCGRSRASNRRKDDGGGGREKREVRFKSSLRAVGRRAKRGRGGGAYATSARARLANRKGGTATTLMVRPIKSVAHPSKLHDAHNNHSFTTYPFKPNRRLFLQKGTLR